VEYSGFFLMDFPDRIYRINRICIIGSYPVDPVYPVLNLYSLNTAMHTFNPPKLPILTNVPKPSEPTFTSLQ